MTENILLNDIVEGNASPSTIVSLPTKGMFYDDDVFKEGIDPMELEVRVLSMMAEQVIKDPIMMASGRGIPHMIKYISPGIAKPEELCEIDIEVIILANRLVSYGSKIIIDHTCANNEPNTCDHKNKIDINLNEILLRYEEFEKIINPINPEMKIERFDQEILFRPMPYKHSISAIKKAFEMQKTFDTFSEIENNDEFVLDSTVMDRYSKIVKDNSEFGIEAISSMIYGVRSNRHNSIINDNDMIKQWLMNIPVNIFDEISERSNSIVEKLREPSKIKYLCEKCQYENNFNLELDYEKLFLSKSEDSNQLIKSSSTSKKKESTEKVRSRVSRK